MVELYFKLKIIGIIVSVVVLAIFTIAIFGRVAYIIIKDAKINRKRKMRKKNENQIR